MLSKKRVRNLAFALAFGLSYVGFTISTEAERIAGEEVTVHSLSISSEAKACEQGQSGWGWGTCNGTRCILNEQPIPGNCNPS
jgi:hypothetical protein